MVDLRALDNQEEDYFHQHPHEVDAYLSENFDEYARDGVSAALLSFLRVIAKSKRHLGACVRNRHVQTGVAKSTIQQR